MYCSRDEAQIVDMTLQIHNTQLNTSSILLRHRHGFTFKLSSAATCANVPQIGTFIHAGDITKQAAGEHSTRSELCCGIKTKPKGLMVDLFLRNGC